ACLSRRRSRRHDQRAHAAAVPAALAVGRKTIAMCAPTRGRSRRAARSATRLNMSGGDEPQRVTPKMLSANVLPMLGVAPEIGRTFPADEDKPGGEAVVILSHGVWQARFGGRAVLDERVLLDGRPATIIGVLPARFRLFQ